MDMAIRYDPQGRQFAMVLEGEVIGFARTAHDATRTLQAVVRECGAVSTAPPSMSPNREDTLPTPQQETDNDPTHAPA